jgi:hypothetical protein
MGSLALQPALEAQRQVGQEVRHRFFVIQQFVRLLQEVFCADLRSPGRPF